MNHPSNGSSSGGGSGPIQPGGEDSPTRPKPTKVCGVCGDRAKSYHFGGISCDSCKAFFRRSVQNEAYRNFHCPYDSKCQITIGSRKCCQFCRFQKCVSIGMEKGWVMTEEERMQLLRSRMEKRQRRDTRPRKASVSEYEPSVSELGRFLSKESVRTIETLVNAYEASYREVPFSDKIDPLASDRTRTEIIDMFFTAIKQFAHFAQRLEPFAHIPQPDQEVLLRTGVLELCFIRGAYAFDECRTCWPDRFKPLYRECPILMAEEVKKLVSPVLFEKHLRFIGGIRELEPDEPTIMLLLVIVLLSPDRPGLQNVELVAKEQEKFYLLMQSYMTWRYGSENTAILYPKLLLKLPDLRELTDAHNDYHLLLAKEEMDEIQRRLSSLRIGSPAPEPLSAGTEASCAEEDDDDDIGSGRRWTMRRDVLQEMLWSSPASIEEESNSSEGSERYMPQRP